MGDIREKLIDKVMKMLADYEYEDTLDLLNLDLNTIIENKLHDLTNNELLDLL